MKEFIDGTEVVPVHVPAVAVVNNAAHPLFSRFAEFLHVDTMCFQAETLGGGSLLRAHCAAARKEDGNGQPAAKAVHGTPEHRLESITHALEHWGHLYPSRCKRWSAGKSKIVFPRSSAKLAAREYPLSSGLILRPPHPLLGPDASSEVEPQENDFLFVFCIDGRLETIREELRHATDFCPPLP